MLQTKDEGSAQESDPRRQFWNLRAAIREWLDAGAVGADPNLAIRLRTFNQMNLAGFVVALFLGPALVAIGMHLSAIVVVLVLCSYVITYRLVRARRSLSARILSLLLIDAGVVVATLETGRAFGLQLFLFPLVTLPLTVFHRGERREAVVCMAVSIAASLGLEAVAFANPPASGGTSPLYLMNVAAVFTVLVIQVLTFVGEADKNHDEAARALCNLESAAQQRRRIETELAGARRIEAMGHLAAGIAHEINTPIQFINDSVYFFGDAASDLLTVSTAADEAVKALAPAAGTSQPEPLRVLGDVIARADLAYLREQLPQAIVRATEGCTRVAEIVRTFKEFSHPDRGEQRAIDLNHAVQGAIILTRNEHKHIADVVTELGELPPVTCCPSQLNQVLLNLLVNAAHAVGDRVKGTAERGKITLSTRVDGASVIVTVSDTGTGIPDKVRHRIFEPYFTTKDIGRGTGQGLAISYRIVESHGGSLTFTTALGVGTSFNVRLPIAGKQATPERTEAA